MCCCLTTLGTEAAYLYSLVATFAPGLFPQGFRMMGGTVAVYYGMANMGRSASDPTRPQPLSRVIPLHRIRTCLMWRKHIWRADTAAESNAGGVQLGDYYTALVKRISEQIKTC